MLGAYYNATTKRIYVEWGSSGTRYTTNQLFTPDGKWHNLIVSSKRLTTDTYMWLDGSQSSYSTAGPQNGLAQPIYLGYYKGISGGTPFEYGFEGLLDEVAIFGGGISSITDAQNLYNGGLPPDLNDDSTYAGGAFLTKALLSVWIRFERDPSNGRNFTAEKTWNASEQTVGATPPMDRCLTWYKFGQVPLPYVNHQTTHVKQPDYAAIADAWGDWSKGLTFPTGGARYALGSGKEVRTLAPGLMPTVRSGWGYNQGGSAWITLNTQEPHSTPIITEDVTTLLPSDQHYPAFNEALQKAMDGRQTRLLKGLFAKKV